MTQQDRLAEIRARVEAADQAKNTDRELWRDGEGYYADSIHVTEGGGIGINVGGTIYVRTLQEWHSAMERLAAAQAELDAARRERDESEGLLSSCTDLLNSWAREWGVSEAPNEKAIKTVAERLWDRMVPEILNLREDKRIAYADVDRINEQLAALQRESARLEQRIAELTTLLVDLVKTVPLSNMDGVGCAYCGERDGGCSIYDCEWERARQWIEANA